jgi:predicted 3-demethylubiquinone-9 3-methyltransferase (glyoxalase superfamily)
MATPQKITTYLWFKDNAEEAVTFYTSLFPGSRITNVARWPEGGPGPAGQVLNMVFELAGQQFMALNGGPQFTFTPAISLFVSCENQAEVDMFWTKLLENGGREDQCGWLQDKFGLSWQIIPTALMELMSDPDREKSARVMQAMFKMRRIDVATLERAHAGA